MNPEVKVGQVWMDWDIRTRAHKYYRLVKVISIYAPVSFDAFQSIPRSYRYPHALVITSYNSGKTWGKYVTRIRIARFKPTSTGYKLTF